MVQNFCPINHMRETKGFSYSKRCCWTKIWILSWEWDKNTGEFQSCLVGDLHLRDYDNSFAEFCPTDSRGKAPTITTKPDTLPGCLEYDRFLLGPGLFSGAFAVSFRVCNRVKDDQRFVRIQPDWCQELYGIVGIKNTSAHRILLPWRM